MTPQAWSASAVIQICHTLTGLSPAAPINALVIDPTLPEWLPKVAIANIAVGTKRVAIDFELASPEVVAHRIVKADPGLRVLRLEPDLPRGRDRLSRAIDMIAHLGSSAG